VADSHARSVAKAVSWRITGTADTFLISWLITGTAALAGGIAATEVATKVVLFYLHERAWNVVRWGRARADAPQRSVAKAVSWRTLAGVDTFAISWLITGRAAAAGSIAATEVFTKVVLFYLHERGWNLLRRERPALGQQASEVAPAGAARYSG
jgi:uncharacterized membrane protein